MPLYVFRCPICQHTVERLQAYADAAPRCPAPEHPPNLLITMQRILAPSSFRILDAPDIHTRRSPEGFRITTTDRRPRKERG